MTELAHDAPLLAGPWDHNRVTFVTLAALTPALGVTIYQNPAGLLTVLATSMFIALAWSLLFAHLRQTTLRWDWIITAVTYAVLVPAGVPMWQQAFALSFGVVVGDQIFGGRGRNILHPTVVALAFLMFSFPGNFYRGDEFALAVATTAGGLLLVGVRLVSWRVVVAIAIGLAVSLAVAGTIGEWSQVLTGAVVFGAAFLIADPVAAASTNAGRWAYGLLAGMLVVVFGEAGGDPGSVRAIIFAALVAGIFAPMIDQAVIWLNLRRRMHRD